MLDPWFIRHIKKPLDSIATLVNKKGVRADQVTLFGFLIGIGVIPLLATQHYLLALLAILINRFLDGLDGALARQQGITDAGGFLDICLDFLFYSAVPFGFVLANPQKNGMAGALLIFSFVGTGSSFLAFANMAVKKGLQDPTYKNKSFYYLTGLTEGSETIFCFILFCLFPSFFPVFAAVFSGLCFITTACRIWTGYMMLKKSGT